jgi:hypothetical protein
LRMRNHYLWRFPSRDCRFDIVLSALFVDHILDCTVS